MNRKALAAVFTGVLLAGLICFIVGFVMYKKSFGNALPVILTVFAMSAGIAIAAIAALALIILIIVALIAKSKNNNGEDYGG